MLRPTVTLLTRAGCSMCERVHARLGELSRELGFEVRVTDVDAEAAGGRPALRAEYGDRLPVVLLDGAEHSYWEVDEPRLRRDLSGPATAADSVVGGPRARGTEPLAEPAETIVGGPRARGTEPLAEPAETIVGGPRARGTEPLAEPAETIVGGPRARGTEPLAEPAENLETT